LIIFQTPGNDITYNRVYIQFMDNKMLEEQETPGKTSGKVGRDKG
jgi:hypothetical protein